MRFSKPASRVPLPAHAMVDDGDELTFCSACAFSDACLANGYSKPELEQLHCLVQHIDDYRAGQHVFRTGDPFRAIYAVRYGMVKTTLVNREGKEQVLGFYLPGEVVGLNAIYPEYFPCDAVALETTGFCRFSFPAINTLATRIPAVQQHLFGLLSKEIGMTSLLAGDHRADERMAAFLVDLGRRYAERGFSGTKFRLSMQRNDIANYLRMVPETVSRVLRRFRTSGLAVVKDREVTLLQAEELEHMGRRVLHS